MRLYGTKRQVLWLPYANPFDSEKPCEIWTSLPAAKDLTPFAPVPRGLLARAERRFSWMTTVQPPRGQQPAATS